MPLGTGGWLDIVEFCKRHDLHLLAADASQPDVTAPAAPVGVAPGAHERLAQAKVALVLGSEGQGVRERSLQDCTAVSIPMSGAMESLNVAVAGAILMAFLSPALSDTVNELDSKTRP